MLACGEGPRCASPERRFAGVAIKGKKAPVKSDQDEFCRRRNVVNCLIYLLQLGPLKIVGWGNCNWLQLGTLLNKRGHTSRHKTHVLCCPTRQHCGQRGGGRVVDLVVLDVVTEAEVGLSLLLVPMRNRRCRESGHKKSLKVTALANN